MLAFYAYQVLSKEKKCSTKNNRKHLVAGLIGESAALLSNDTECSEYSNAFLITDPNAAQYYYNIQDMYNILNNAYYSISAEIKEEGYEKESKVFLTLAKSLENYSAELSRIIGDKLTNMYSNNISYNFHILQSEIESNYNYNNIIFDNDYFKHNSGHISDYREILFNTISLELNSYKNEKLISYESKLLLDNACEFYTEISSKYYFELGIRDLNTLVNVMRNIALFIDKKSKKYLMLENSENKKTIAHIFAKTLQLDLFHSDFYNEVIDNTIMDSKVNRNDIREIIINQFDKLKKYKLVDIIFKSDEIKNILDNVSRYLMRYGNFPNKNTLFATILTYFRPLYEKYSLFSLTRINIDIDFSQNYDKYKVNSDISIDMDWYKKIAEESGFFAVCDEYSFCKHLEETHLMFLPNIKKYHTIFPIILTDRNFSIITFENDYMNAQSTYTYNLNKLNELKKMVDEVKSVAFEYLLDYRDNDNELLDDDTNTNNISKHFTWPDILRNIPLTSHLLMMYDMYYHQYTSLYEIIGMHIDKNIEINLLPLINNVANVASMILINKLIAYSAIIRFMRDANMMVIHNTLSLKELDLLLFENISEAENDFFKRFDDTYKKDSHTDYKIFFNNSLIIRDLILLYYNFKNSRMMKSKSKPTQDFLYVYNDIKSSYSVYSLLDYTANLTNNILFENHLYLGIPMTRWVYNILFLDMLKHKTFNDDTLTFMVDLYNALETHYVIDLDHSKTNARHLPNLPIFICEQLADHYSRLQILKKNNEYLTPQMAKRFEEISNVYKNSRMNFPIGDLKDYVTEVVAAYTDQYIDEVKNGEFYFSAALSNFANNYYLYSKYIISNKNILDRIDKIYEYYRREAEIRYNEIQMHSLFKELRAAINESHHDEIVEKYFLQASASESIFIRLIYNIIHISNNRNVFIFYDEYTQNIHYLNSYAPAILTFLNKVVNFKTAINECEKEKNIPELINNCVYNYIRALALLYNDLEFACEELQIDKNMSYVCKLIDYAIDRNSVPKRIHDKRSYYASVIKTVKRAKILLDEREERINEVNAECLERI